MSSKRIDFFSAQNNFAEIKAKALQVDDLGDGFKIADYEHLATEVQTLSSRIDQNEEKLDKMRGRFNNEKKKHEATKGRMKEVLEMTKEKEEKLNAVIKNEKKNRKMLSELKGVKDNLEEKIGELKEKSGILCKKSLMQDFDKINDEIQTISEENLKLEAANEKKSAEVNELNKIIDNKNMQKNSLKHLDDLISCEEKVFALSKRKAHIFSSRQGIY